MEKARGFAEIKFACNRSWKITDRASYFRCPAGYEIIVGIITRQQHLRANPDIAGNSGAENTCGRMMVESEFCGFSAVQFA